MKCSSYWLFQEDVFARFGSSPRHLGVKVNGNCNIDRVDVRTGKQFRGRVQDVNASNVVTQGLGIRSARPADSNDLELFGKSQKKGRNMSLTDNNSGSNNTQFNASQAPRLPHPCLRLSYSIFAANSICQLQREYTGEEANDGS